MDIRVAESKLVGRGARRLEVPPCRILVAEDDDEMRVLLCRALARDGYEIRDTKDGTELLERLADSYTTGTTDEDYDLIISDVRMPGWTGLQLLAGLRGIRGLPIILITAFGDAGLHQRARLLGAVATLDKPFDLDDLRTLVCHVLSRPRIEG